MYKCTVKNNLPYSCDILFCSVFYPLSSTPFAMNLLVVLCVLAVVVSQVHGGYGGLFGGYGPFLGYGGLFGGFPYLGFGGYGYGGKGSYGYGGSRYKRAIDSNTDAQHSPVTHYSPAVHVVHSSSNADASPVHHASPEHHVVYNAVPASRAVHVSGHFSPAVVYSYPVHHGGNNGNTYSNYGYTSTPSYGFTTPSYGLSYGHGTPSYKESPSGTPSYNTVVHGQESPSGTPSYNTVVHGH